MVHAGVVAPDFNQHPPGIVQIPIYQLETLNIWCRLFRAEPCNRATAH
jgi:hypothetical protein